MANYIPPSQSSFASSQERDPRHSNSRNEIFCCQHCDREFLTKGGRTKHQNRCKEKPEPEPPDPVPIDLVACTSALKIWGNHTKNDAIQIISAIYEEIVFWRRNVFKLPSGNAGKKYIQETIRLANAWNEDSDSLKDIALKAVMIMPSILLQKANQKSTSKENSEHLKRRMSLWEEGYFDKLMEEARTIQQRLRKQNQYDSEKSLPKRFADLMMKGRVQAAVRLLDEEEAIGVQTLDAETMKTLQAQHPRSNPASEEILLTGDLAHVNSIVYEAIDASDIQKAALHTKGAAGPSGMDALGWRRILISKNFGPASSDLCASLARMTRKLCRTLIDKKEHNGKQTSSIEAYLACRLIPLQKKPNGVRPIGIGEVLRRIIGKAILSVFKKDVMESAGSIQLCAGQSSGCEAAVHTMNTIFEEDATDGILMVDASNAFNSINREAILHNMKRLCPVLSTYVINCYQHPSRLFLLGGKEIASEEGTTQGDPLSMPTYALGLTPLLMLLEDTNANRMKHVAYADDIAGAGNLLNMRKWWDDIIRNGPPIGYFPKANKSWLVVKDEHQYSAAEKIFEGTGVRITTAGRKYLGGIIGSDDYVKEHLTKLVTSWIKQIDCLATIAKSEPQAALAAFNSGLKHKFTYHLRCIPQARDFMQPVEDVIREKLIPALTDGYHCSDNERLLLSLPARLGGLGIPIFTNSAEEEFRFSSMLTEPLSRRLYNLDRKIDNLVEETADLRRQITKQRKDRQERELEFVRRNMTEDDRKANDIARMKGASSWITTLPLQDENFVLNKREFHDAICVRYRWEIKHLPIVCVCGSPFTIDHSVSCKKGGYIIHRHNEIRDTIAAVLDETCRDVRVEPQLLPLTGEQLGPQANKSNEARLDISAVGFWTRGDRAFFDVRIFNPFALKHRRQTLDKSLATNESEKKKQYNQRVIEVEHGSFTPLVFTANGGMGRECLHFVSVLADKIAIKRNLHVSEVSNWLRTKLSFALIRSLVLGIRGNRGRKKELAVDVGDLLICNQESKME